MKHNTNNNNNSKRKTKKKILFNNINTKKSLNVYNELNKQYTRKRIRRVGIHSDDYDEYGFLDRIQKRAENVYVRVKRIFESVHDEYPPYVKKVLDDIQNDYIKECIVVIDKDSLLMFISMLCMNFPLIHMAQLKKNMNIGIYHLYMIVTLNSGKLIRIEKNLEIDVTQIPNIVMVYSDSIIKVDLKGITVNTLLNNTLKSIGNRNFWDFDIINNNCQDFIRNILNANGINTYVD